VQVPKISQNLIGLPRNVLIISLALFSLGLAQPLMAQNRTAIVGFGMGQNFSTNEFYYRGTFSLFANESMWGLYQAFEYRPPQEAGGLHFKLPTGFYAKVRGPLYFHYGMDAVTSIAFNDKLRHDVGLSLRFSGLQLKFNYAGRDGFAAQLAVPVK